MPEYLDPQQINCVEDQIASDRLAATTQAFALTVASGALYAKVASYKNKRRLIRK